ncbi:MAG: VWA domain-containing protein [Spirochaetes bacterium]|jgi:hypothetical protein|nr:VWA domain-containing protein [Spirochaetota bacterium]
MFGAIDHVPASDRNIFKQTLKTTLIKDFTDIPIFDKCFDEFFGTKSDMKYMLRDISIDRAADIGRMKKDPNMTRSEMEMMEDLMDRFIESLSENLIFQKSAEELLKIFMEDEMTTSGSSGGMGMALFKARNDVIQSHDNSMAGDSEMEPDEDMMSALRMMMGNRLLKKRTGTTIKNRENYLLNKNIYKITPDEIKEMRELIRRFGQKLKNRISLRKKRVKHGGIDIKRTFRSSLQFGGVPFRLFFKDRKIDRPQLVILCDVSGSVNQYTRFMLLLTHTLQSLFSKVRTFAFISNMVEITKLFMEMDPERAINSIFHDTNFTYGWGSNYGRCFNQFMSNHSDSLTGKTTVLILGDGRNNNQDPGLDSFIRIGEKSRNMFWLNPDKKHLWNWSDSLAYLYREHCNEMREVNNFLDLSEFIDKLFLD